MLENELPEIIFLPERADRTGVWGKLEHQNLFLLPDIFRTIKVRKVRWKWYVAQMEIREVHAEF
jgi:hypothetical protein